MSEFARWEQAAGGPDPHMVLSGEMSRNVSLEERVWRGGCYIAVYNAPFGEAFWLNWPWERIQREAVDLEPWLEANWAKVVTRRERRCVRRPEWMAEYLLGYAKFAKEFPDLIQACHNLSPTDTFAKVWDASLTVPRLGRYVAIKLLEYYRRYCGVNLKHPDIRPMGGRSPREMLSYLWPEYKQVNDKDDSPEMLKLVNKLAKQTQLRLRDDFDVIVDMFVLQVVLCDYKQAWKSARQYPGRSIDSELMYAFDAEAKWGHKSEIWEARLRVFPAEHLGELQGWSAPRSDIAECLVRHNYTWSDLLFNYNNTSNLADPVTQATSSRRINVILDNLLFQSSNWTLLKDNICQQMITYHGITGIVTLWKDDPRLKQWVKWYHAYPIPDGKKLDGEQLEHLADNIVEQLKAGERIVVMCHAGRNRSALLNTLVVRKWLGISGEAALDYVRKRRPRSVDNDAFEDYLRTLPSVQAERMPIKGKPPRGLLF